jgi:hypothetical protein
MTRHPACCLAKLHVSSHTACLASRTWALERIVSPEVDASRSLTAKCVQPAFVLRLRRLVGTSQTGAVQVSSRWVPKPSSARSVRINNWQKVDMLYSAVVETFHAERRPLRRTAIRTQANAMSGSLAEFTADSIPSRKHVDAACARGADGAKACAAHT